MSTPPATTPNPRIPGGGGAGWVEGVSEELSGAQAEGTQRIRMKLKSYYVPLIEEASQQILRPGPAAAGVGGRGSSFRLDPHCWFLLVGSVEGRGW